MKRAGWKIGVVVVVMLGMMGFGSTAMALTVLEDGDQKVVYDADNQQYWYWDMSAFTNQTYEEQKASIDELNINSYYGTTDWHMADSSDFDVWSSWDDTSIIEAFNSTQTSFGQVWQGRFDIEWQGMLGPRGPEHMTADIVEMPGFYYRAAGSYTSDSICNLGLGAWVVATEAPQVDPVPEPGTLCLLAVGLLGVVVLRRKASRKG